MVEGKRTEAGKHKSCLSIYVFDIYSTRTAANRNHRFQGIDFRKVDFVDGLGSAIGLGAGGIAEVERVIMKHIESRETFNDGRKIVLVLDGLDFMLAATDCEVLGLLDMIGELREVRLLSNYRLVAACTFANRKPPRNSTSILQSLQQLPTCPFLSRPLPLLKYAIRHS